MHGTIGRIRQALAAAMVVAVVVAVAMCTAAGQAYGLGDSGGKGGRNLAAVSAQAASSYKIVFKLGGGRQAVDQVRRVKAGEKLSVARLGAPTRKGYAFAGWYRDAGLAKRAKAVRGARPKARRTVYAKWSAVAYALSYELNGGVLVGAYDSAYTVLSSPRLPELAREGYRLDGWYFDAGFTAPAAFSPSTVGVRTLYAKWTPEVYRVDFDLGGGSIEGPGYAMYTILSAPDLPVPAREGYEFKGWFEDAELQQRADLRDGCVGDRMLYAKWYPTGGYRIEYVLQGGELGDDAPLRYDGSEDVSLPQPSRAGYAFLGWYADPEMTRIAASVPAGSEGDITFYAKWRKRALVAHRGLRDNAPENSLAAFAAAAAKGFEMVETDVRFTSDGMPVLYHDETASVKSADGSGAHDVAISTMTYDDLQRADLARAKAGSEGRNVTTFRECMEGCRDLGLDVRIHLYIGEEWQVGALATIVNGCGMAEHVQWFSNNIAWLNRVKAIYPSGRFVYSHDITSETLDAVEALASDGADAMAYNHVSMIGEDEIALCKARGVPLATWDVHDETAASLLDPFISSLLIDTLRGDKVPDPFGL